MARSLDKKDKATKYLLRGSLAVASNRSNEKIVRDFMATKFPGFMLKEDAIISVACKDVPCHVLLQQCAPPSSYSQLPGLVCLLHPSWFSVIALLKHTIVLTRLWAQ